MNLPKPETRWAFEIMPRTTVRGLNLMIKKGFLDEAMPFLAERARQDLADGKSFRFGFLPIACYFRCLPLVELILSPPHRVMPKHHIQKSIYAAIASDADEILSLLLTLEFANPTHADNSPVGVAAAMGHTRCLNVLLEDNRVNPSAVNGCALEEAISLQRTEACFLLLKHERTNPNLSTIISAVRSGNLELVRYLLEDPRFTPAAKGNMCIRSAAKRGFTEIARLLLEDERVDPSVKENRALKHARDGNHQDIVEMLEARAAVSDAIPTAMFDAADS